MNIRLLADANFNYRVVHGLRRRIPALDFAVAHGIIPPRLPDRKVLNLAANLERVLLSHDVRTMPGHFYRLLEDRESPGLILVQRDYPIGLAIKDLELLVSCSASGELRNRITWLPY